MLFEGQLYFTSYFFHSETHTAAIFSLVVQINFGGIFFLSFVSTLLLPSLNLFSPNQN